MEVKQHRTDKTHLQNQKDLELQKLLDENAQSIREIKDVELTQEVIDLRDPQESKEQEPVDSSVSFALNDFNKEELEMARDVSAEKHVSLNFGVLGSGQAGGRIAEVFYKYGYDTCVVNTATQDLKFLDLPEDKKLLIGMENKTLGGAGKDLDIGSACAESSEEELREFITSNLEDAEAVILCVSGGGGSGSGSAPLLVELLSELGKPILVIFVLPGAFDDPQAKHNSVVTLSKMADLASKQVINSLILVDNANIERRFSSLSQAKFFETANKAVVEPLHNFNSLSTSPTNYEALDQLDFAKALIESGNCVVFGTNTVTKEMYEDNETALMDSIIEGLSDGLLASGFELTEAQTVGVLVTANQEVLESVPFTNIAYMFKYIAEEFDSARSYKGVYAVPSDSDDITVQFVFSGLGLPKERVDTLSSETKKHMDALEAKKKLTSMKVGTVKQSATDEIDRKFAKAKNKKTGIGKLIGGGGIKRRR